MSKMGGGLDFLLNYLVRGCLTNGMGGESLKHMQLGSPLILGAKESSSGLAREKRTAN